MYLLVSVAECQDGNSRLVNPSISATYNSNGTVNNTITGLIELCINGTWLTVCYDEYQFTEGNRKLIHSTCQNMGYDGMCVGHIAIIRSTSSGLHTVGGRQTETFQNVRGKSVSLCDFHLWYINYPKVWGGGERGPPLFPSYPNATLIMQICK